MHCGELMGCGPLRPTTLRATADDRIDPPRLRFPPPSCSADVDSTWRFPPSTTKCTTRPAQAIGHCPAAARDASMPAEDSLEAFGAVALSVPF